METNSSIKDNSEERYYRLIHFLTDYIYTVELENGKAVNTYHGPGCVAVTGYTSEDYKNDPELWYRMVHPEDRTSVLELSKKAQAGLQIQPLEHRIIHRDGTIRWVKNNIVYVKDKNGKVIYYDGLINDITELKNAEELTAVKQKQLIQADKMVALGTMVSGIAHEINNPNNFILLNAQFLQKVLADVQPIIRDYYETHGDFAVAGIPFSSAKEKIVKSLESILEGTVRIQTITRSLTNFARKDSGELTQDIDINSVIEISIIITSNLIKKSTEKFKVHYYKNIPLVKGNKQQLEQVVINLINNACQSLTNKEQGVSILINIDEIKKNVIVEISDEGSGIEAENLNYIFDPFFTTKRNSGGTGLGLYISYNIIKSHGGELEVRSEKGKGTTFRIIIPINK